MRATEFLAEITRRDFLRGAGAAAGSAVMGSPQAQTPADVEAILSDGAYLYFYCKKYFPNDPRTAKLKALVQELKSKKTLINMFDNFYTEAEQGFLIMSTTEPQQLKNFVAKIFSRYNEIVNELDTLVGLQA